MPTLQNFNKEDYARLFASDVKDATVAAAAANALQPDSHNRTIIIGIGGTGVRTLDHIKGAIEKRLQPTWRNYVAFMGIDTSWTELDNAHYLNKQEGVCITQDGIAQRMQQLGTYPRAVRRFMIDGADGQPVNMVGLGGDGASRTRLFGKITIHDQAAGSMGVDEKIVSKIQSIMATLQPLPAQIPGNPPSFYDVYVVGSGSGGTGSGGFLEMPSLIREAMAGYDVHIHGILYLPDTLTTLDPANAGALKANGYATLKEFNYFQGMQMRTDFSETWTYSNPARSELQIQANQGFYNTPYLIGSPGAAAADAADVARETIAEFLVSMLGKATPVPGAMPFLTSAFYSNAISTTAMNNKAVNPGNSNLEAVGTAHEFPKMFCSIGFAEASAPETVIRAYAVKETCKNAGLKPVDDETFDALSGDANVTMMPFRSAEQKINATVGTTTATDILKPLQPILGVIHNGNFNFISDLHLAAENVTFDTIKRGTYDAVTFTKNIDKVIDDKTDVTNMEKLRDFISARYEEYKANVMAYVQKEGPFAFVNLYNGSFTEVNGNSGLGIAKMLQNLVAGRMMNGNPFNWTSPLDAEGAKNSARDVINNNNGLLGMHLRKGQAANWITAMNNLSAAKINEKRREVALGNNGALMELFVRPAAQLTEQIEIFGNILVAMSDVYVHHGSAMDGFNSFSDATDTRTEVNVASVNSNGYAWLKRQADSSVANVDAKEFRDGLVASFFADPTAWLDVPGHLVSITPAGEASLVTPDKPVPAREMFDAYATEKIPLTVDVSILALFEELQRTGTPFDQTADALLSKLAAKSQIRFNGNPDNQYLNRYIKYPNSLNLAGGNGPAVVQAIQTAAATYGVTAANVYPSDDTNTIMFYQQATSMEVYRINGLADWEAEYENAIRTVPVLLHGKSPDVVRVVDAYGNVSYQENTSWQDYPSIVCRQNPERPDPNTGEICREGLNRLALQAEVEQAKKLGVLYSEKDATGKWRIRCVNCDKATEWTFDVTMCTPDANTGLLPQGKELAFEIAHQNGKAINQMTRVVRLELAGLFSAPASSEEYAWSNALRVLNHHRPMLTEMRRTVELFKVWDRQVDDFNAGIRARFRPAMMMYLLKAGILTRNANGAWEWKKADGTTKMIANYAPAMLNFINAVERSQISNGLLGYHLYKRVNSVMAGDLLKSECDRAKSLIEGWINTGDMIPLERGQELFALIENEQIALAEKGAGDGEGPTSYAFVNAMASLEKDPAKLKEIEQFYHRTTMWSYL